MAEHELTPSATVVLEQATLMATSARVGKELQSLKEKLQLTSTLESLRSQAIADNLTSATHRVLDLVGVPFVPQEQASKLCVNVIRNLHIEAFKEIQHQHPEAMRRWLSHPPAVAALIIAFDVATKRITKKRRLFFDLATQFGADWSIPRPGLAKEYPKAMETYDQLVASASANVLSLDTPTVPSEGSRPGLRF